MDITASVTQLADAIFPIGKQPATHMQFHLSTSKLRLSSVSGYIALHLSSYVLLTEGLSKCLCCC